MNLETECIGKKYHTGKNTIINGIFPRKKHKLTIFYINERML